MTTDRREAGRDPHMHDGEYCARCVRHGMDLAADPAPLEFSESLATVRVLGLTVDELRVAVATADQYHPQWRHDLALAADPVPPLDEDGRPPLDPAVVAHDKAYMAGLIRGRELEREAHTLAAEPPTLDVVPDHVWRYQHGTTHAIGCCVHGPVIEPPALDVERAERIEQAARHLLSAWPNLVHHPSMNPSEVVALRDAIAKTEETP